MSIMVTSKEAKNYNGTKGPSQGRKKKNFKQRLEKADQS